MVFAWKGECLSDYLTNHEVAQNLIKYINYSYTKYNHIQMMPFSVFAVLLSYDRDSKTNSVYQCVIRHPRVTGCCFIDVLLL